MIVGRAPRLKRTFYGAWRVLLALFMWDVAVTAFYFASPFQAPALPLTLYGAGLALILGARSNFAYARWWESRGLWGLMTNASRGVAREANAFIGGPDPAAADLRRGVVLRQIAYVHALRCQLRRQDPAPDVRRILGPELGEAALKRRNPANGLLDDIALRIAEARQRGLIDTIQQTQMEGVLVDIANAQGGMERLKNTPLPAQFRTFPSFFTRLFCILVPVGLVSSLGVMTPVGSMVASLMFLTLLRIGDDLVDPFANTVHDIPLSTICATIETDLMEAIGEVGPDKMEPVDGVLW